MKAKKIKAVIKSLKSNDITNSIGEVLTVNGKIVSNDITLTSGKSGAIHFSDGTVQTTAIAMDYTPLQQGGGAGQGDNKVSIGWNESLLGLKAQVVREGSVDDLGCIFTSPTALQLTLLPLTNLNPANSVGGMLILSGAAIPAQKIATTEYPAQQGENLIIDAWGRQDIGNVIRMYRGNPPQPCVFTFNCDTGVISATNVVTSGVDINAAFKAVKIQLALLESQLTAFEKQLTVPLDKPDKTEEYGSRLDLLDCEIEELDGQTSALNNQLANLLEYKSIADQQITSLSEQITNLTAITLQVITLKTDVTELTSKITDVNSNLDSINSQVQTLKIQPSYTDSFRNEIDILNSQLAASNNQINLLGELTTAISEQVVGSNVIKGEFTNSNNQAVALDQTDSLFGSKASQQSMYNYGSLSTSGTVTGLSGDIGSWDGDFSNIDSYANIFASVGIFAPNVCASVVDCKTMTGTALHAVYSDLAERYEADKAYPLGTLVKIGGKKEITETTDEYDCDVFGVISDQPAFLMNSDAGTNDSHPKVGLIGRIYVRVIGVVKKGDSLTASEIAGVAKSIGELNTMGANALGYVLSRIGRALEDKDTSEEGLILAYIGR